MFHLASLLLTLLLNCWNCVQCLNQCPSCWEVKGNSSLAGYYHHQPSEQRAQCEDGCVYLNQNDECCFCFAVGAGGHEVVQHEECNANGAATTTNYCGISSDHTMCKYTGPSTTCAANTISRELDATAQQAIIDKHNELRRKVAKGEETRGNPGPQPAAADMVMAVWDNELATIAQRWADQCTFGHDTNRNTAEGSVGQNAYIGSSTATMSASSLAASYASATTAWYEEVNSPGFSKDSINPFVYSSGAGHYTQVVWGSVRKIGCGSVYYKESSGSFPYKQLIMCNYYQAGNLQGGTMYTAGTACSSCPTAYPTCSDSLCTK